MITVNKRALADYFPSKTHQMILTEPLRATELTEAYDIDATIDGGGPTGQAGALRLGIARALIELDPELRPALKQAGFLTRDAAEKESKKYGLKKARKAPQYSQALERCAASAHRGLRSIPHVWHARGAEVRDRRRARGREPRADAGAGARPRARRGSRARWRTASWSGATPAGRGRCSRRRLIAGLTAEGVEVTTLGVVPTPAVAWLAAAEGAAGAVISASHNPFADNGVKLFPPAASKLTDEVEAALEAELHALLAPPGARRRRARATPSARSSTAPTGVDRWADSVVALDRGPRARRAVASWSTAPTAPPPRSRPRCCGRSAPTVEVLHDEPDGTNINAGCGSTHPEDLQTGRRRRAAPTSGSPSTATPTGCWPSTPTGRLIDGDQIIAICAIDRRDHGRLAKDTVVVTVMTNLGFRLGMARARHRGPRGARRRPLRARGAGRRGSVARRRAERARRSSPTWPPPATGCSPPCSSSTSCAARAGRSRDLADAAMTRLPQVLRNVRVADEGHGRHRDAGRRHRGGRGRARRPRPGAGPRERHRAARAGDGRGPHRTSRRRPRPTAWCARWRASGRADPAGTLVRSPNRKATTSVCGIIAVLRGPGARLDLPPADVLDRLDRGPAARSTTPTRSPRPTGAAELLEELDGLLRSPDGVALLVRDREVAARTAAVGAAVGDWVAAVEAEPRRRTVLPTGHSLEDGQRRAAPAQGRAVGRGARPPADRRRPCASSSATEPVVVGHRGRHLDPAGAVRARPARGARPRLGRAHRARPRPRPRPRRSRGRRAWSPRAARDHLFRSNAVRTPEGHLSFVYKAAAEIGELGDNTAAMRADLLADDLLRLALTGERASAVVLGHTRWASIGIISPAQRPPVDSLELDGDAGPVRHRRPQRRRRQLRRPEGGRRAPPRRRDHHRRQGHPHPRVAPPGRGRRPHRPRSATRWPASRARWPSAPARATHPDHLLLALRGSGQALYVGLADGCFVVASEPYGLVELTPSYLRLDGDTPANPENPNASRGQIVVLDGARAGPLEGITRQAYDGTAAAR